MTEIAHRTPQQELITKLSAPDAQEQLGTALEGSGISVPRFTRIAHTALAENPDLAEADERSVFSSLMRCATDGLVPDGREAALVIFNTKTKIDGRDVWVKKAQYLAMIGGLRKRVAEFGWSIFTACVYENDGFDPDLETGKANHKPTRLGQDRGPLLGAYAVAQHKDGRRMIEVIDKAGIDKIRNVSRAKDRGPWVDWYEQMAEIRPAKRLVKKLPLDPKDRESLNRVLAATDLDTGERVDLLYGPQDSPGPLGERTPTPEAASLPPSAQASDQQAPASTTREAGAPGPEVIEAEATEVPFEGEEPPPVTDTRPVTSEDEPTFSAGRYSGKTLDEIFALGKEGLSYLQWAFKSWKGEPMRSALDRFAADHPDVST